MTKKGFTLTELLAVIVIMSVVALIAVPRLINSIKSNNIDAYNNIIEDVILAANSYANNKDGTLVQISVSTLQDEGYLPVRLANPVDNTELHGCVYVVEGDPIYKEEACSTYLKNIIPTRIISAKCEHKIGSTWEFSYKGLKENFEVPCDGTYKLEVWGAQGGSAGDIPGGKGGYSTGEKKLTFGDTLSVVVGSAGAELYSSDGTQTGGYNGGGIAKIVYKSALRSGSGGGASHIALENENYDTLASYGNASVAANYLLVVAGGGGGAGYSSSSNYGAGGAGGGETGGNGESLNGKYGTGGTQEAGGYFKNGSSVSRGLGSFGQGATIDPDSSNYYGGAGGGGFYGGGSSSSSYTNGGGGGSGYIADLENASTLAGDSSIPSYDGLSTMIGNTGNGYAKITLVSY